MQAQGVRAAIESETPTPRVLFVEDDAVLAAELVETFVLQGMAARAAADWDAALALLADWPPDLVVLDQRLGRMDTLDRLPALRALTAAPVLMLTANRAEADRIAGLDLGADDFLLKPIASRELLARARAHLRRGPHAPVAGWRFAHERRLLLRPDGSEVPLTAAEFDLLALLAASPGAPVSRERLTEVVLRRPYRAEDRALDNLVLQIRRKLGADGVVRSLRNQGYAFTGFLPAAG